MLVAVLYFALAPSPALMFFKSDKAGHLTAFTVLMLWFGGIFRLRMSPFVALGLLAFGIMIELLQNRLDYRSAEIADAVFDCGGILIGWALVATAIGRWAGAVESWLPRKGT